MFFRHAIVTFFLYAGFVFPSEVNAQLIDRPPTGLATLHCNAPNAEASCAQLVNAMYESGIDEVTLNYLVDGTFGFDPDRMMNHIALLTEGGRKLYLTFYLINGPAQRKCRQYYTDGFAARMCPGQFGHAIMTDYATQVGYQLLVARLLPVIDFATERGANIYISPMLEDNLNVHQFVHMTNLIQPFFPNNLNVWFLRNPSGGDGIIPFGVVREKHPTSANKVNFSGGFATNDGKGFKFPSGQPKSRAEHISYNTMRKIRNAAHARGNIFIAWNAEAQGIYGGARVHVSQRKFYVINRTQQLLLIDFLRGR